MEARLPTPAHAHVCFDPEPVRPTAALEFQHRVGLGVELRHERAAPATDQAPDRLHGARRIRSDGTGSRPGVVDGSTVTDDV